MYALKPGDKSKTKQDYGTPDDFFAACSKQLNFTHDLAASEDDTRCVRFISEESDSLGYGWHKIENSDWLWLNPPFSNITPWAKKCHEESRRGAKIALLTPASVGANWFGDYVFNKSLSLFLKDRLTFKGTKQNAKTGKCDPYPKDCMLSLYANSFPNGVAIWDWKNRLMF